MNNFPTFDVIAGHLIHYIETEPSIHLPAAAAQPERSQPCQPRPLNSTLRRTAIL